MAEADDGILPALSLKSVGADAARASSHNSCLEIQGKLGRRPDTLLLHATPGFEERIIEGVSQSWHGNLMCSALLL